MTALRRIQKELRDLQNNPIENVSIKPEEDNLFHWKGAIRANSDSPYKGGTFQFRLELPNDFPFKPPTVTFTTKIYHPGINEEGAVCVPVLRNEWKPAMTLSSVLCIIQDKLNNPSADDPYEPDIAALMKTDKAKFQATAREWTRKPPFPPVTNPGKAMHRFRKRSDAKRSTPPQFLADLSSDYQPPSPKLSDSEALPELPPESDFRTSLILPDLSRRFSLLRTATGDPVPLQGLKNRLANQRARGAQHQISEEEEDIILQTLGEIHSQDDDMDRYSASSSADATNPSTAEYRGRRNLFGGSARFQDYNYIRSVASQRSLQSDASATQMESLRDAAASEGPRPATPESEKGFSPPGRNSSSSTTSQPMTFAEYRLSKVLKSPAFKRVSLAFENAIKELEEDVEDEIVLPRFGPSSRRNSEDRTQPELTDNYEPGMAISSDHISTVDERAASPRGASPLPSQALPGYIPGMPRPMTPRHGFETDELRSHSTTPRAGSSAPSLNLTMAALKREHDSLSFSPRSTTSSRVSQEEDRPRDTLSLDFDTSLTSSILGRRRPASPLSITPYQPMSVSSRPSTPSNVVWEHSPKSSGHSRNGSWMSDSGTGDLDAHNAVVERSMSVSRSLRSPALPDSPLIDGTSGIIRIPGSQKADVRSHSPMVSLDLGSPVISHNRIRSPTPVQSDQRSPTSSTFSSAEKPTRNGIQSNSKPSPRHNSSSPFSFGSFNPFIFSSFDNSSRSSLESDGSSYHSRDDISMDPSLSLFSDSESQKPAWHDLSGLDYSTVTTSADSHLALDAEETMKRCAGLTKGDFFAIQDKLVSVAAARTSPVERAPSMRRRRPSTSQSNYSISRVASPAPNVSQTISPSPSPSPAPVIPETAKTKALLEDMAQRRPSPSPVVIPPTITNVAAGSASASEPTPDFSPTSRRNRDLARVLFGQSNESSEFFNSTSADAATTKQKDTIPPVSATSHIANSPASSLTPSPGKNVLATPNSPYLVLRNTSTPKIPQSPEEHEELAREVQRKTEAAMDALRKNGSTTKLHDTLGGAPAVKKRITLKHISNPQFVSSSTSLETVPLPQGSGKQSKMSQRIKKLRGTLRTKPTQLNGEEVTPYPLDPYTSPSLSSALSPQLTQSPASQRTLIAPVIPHAPPMSATEPSTFKYSIPSPPASAGPGLKSFIMSRFRGKQRPNETGDHDSAPSPTPRHRASPTLNMPPTPQTNPYFHDTQLMGQSTVLSPQGSSYGNTDTAARPWSPLAADSGEDAQALQQLYEAASHFGLDQETVSDLLARKASSASRSTTLTNLTRSNTATSGMTMAAPGNETALDIPSPSTVRKLSLRKRADVNPRPQQRDRDGRPVTAVSAIVRRTVIFPSDTRSSTIDIGALVRKTSKSRKRTSAQSVSNRSILDRVPTPPPPRSPTSRRFSSDNGSPPVPQVPSSLASPSESHLRVPKAFAGGSVEKSSSAYESLYDMYTEENKANSSTAAAEPGPAIEVIELANGQTIWSIVNGLRDDDMDSVYESRNSFASEYSARDDDMQVFVKDHTRTGSKGSNSSFLSRKKNTGPALRPETKVFYSSPAHIGRLIENLSEGMDAGSFKFLVGNEGVHSNSSSLSDAHWTLEERLDHMLASAMSRPA